MQKNWLFQYCQNLVILSSQKTSVLLAKRIGEQDYNGTFSFVGGKLEVTDKTIVAGMKREKDEELGEAVKVLVYPYETYNVLFRKKDGNSMIIPHVAGIFKEGDIVLSDEYSEYQWVKLDNLKKFEPKIENITELTEWAVKKLSEISLNELVEI